MPAPDESFARLTIVMTCIHLGEGASIFVREQDSNITEDTLVSTLSVTMESRWRHMMEPTESDVTVSRKWFG